ncbi:predicted protein [Nematostella vectensis]|uniref:Protoheme IX farnesyltransferase, mitochondrial n=1 Tax=Nematostella vectensis TaxID=45351 RepID=A7RJI6_NEMVE|nr:protoheme IX farnesyltransferase, mitochondrial [Nematostella vectensis]XP_048575968.1 protoheme IX farnesyltransferase, mitochondrial [Nematostella vectensis]XP_048575969.1 protoheme IX farnesyltransferase, mitochondrial [Nematostella vectensis]EDO48268.1 predicted protein [Nematostella vectensis]|eukprot:XP_001640331.1 predicted protein [Nematostella vectensis]
MYPRVFICRSPRLCCVTPSWRRDVNILITRRFTCLAKGRHNNRICEKRFFIYGNATLRCLQSSTSSIVKTLSKKETLEEVIAKKGTAVDTSDEELWIEQRFDLKLLPGYYARLSKIRLSGMVVLTAMAGYALAPAPMYLDTFLWASLGTGLCSAAANSFNQWLEVPFDSQMNRTKNRVLVRGLLSPLHVLSFGVVSGSLGVATLLLEVNTLTALLGAFNIALYTCIYTPMKRLSIANTWVGSVVGALPPLMGWAACTGTLHPGAFVFAGLLYSWQFPHFNALSWNLRPDYSRAGYRMMCVTDPALCRRVALRHSLSLIGLCTLLPVCDVTSWWLALDTLPLNAWLTFLAYKFYRDSDSNSSRKLFRFSLLHLPVLMLLVMFHKKPKQKQTEGVLLVDSIAQV